MSTDEVEFDSSEECECECDCHIVEVCSCSDSGSADESMEDEEEDEYSLATLRFVIPNFNTLRDPVLSPPTYFKNVPWRIMAMPTYLPGERDDQSTKFLGFYLRCNGESDSTTWSCFAAAQLKLISQKEGFGDYVKSIDHVFNSKGVNCGLPFFMAWNAVIDPEEGYIKDDTVILEVILACGEINGNSLCQRDQQALDGVSEQMGSVALDSR